MKKSPSKRRGPWIDVFLVCSIITLGSIIFYFTIIQNREAINDVSASATTDEPLVEHTTEQETSLANVKLLEERATHTIHPFVLQYPQTNDITMNEQITTYVTTTKDTYMQQARTAFYAGFEQAGTLHITSELSSHADRYYSFVLTTTMQLPNNETTTTLETFFFNAETGEPLTIEQLFNHDEKSLATFVDHVQAELKAGGNEQFALLADKLTVDWHHFSHFSLDDDKLTVYFLQDGVPPVVPFTVSLSFLNPLLDAQFQTAMAETAIPTPTPATQTDADAKRIALTFDDGPHPTVTPQILATLAKYNAKATFFVLGTRVSQSPEILKQASDAGHEIGNHTWSHPKLPKLNTAQILSEFQTTETLIQQVLQQPSKIFRPPYGMSNDAVKSVIPITMINWTIDTEDWRHRNAQMLLPSVQNALHNNAIVLMHDIHQSTADGLESVLAYLQKEGYQFMTVSEILPYR